MKTKKYNPSDLEVAFAKTLQEQAGLIFEKFGDHELVNVSQHLTKDNPDVVFEFKDSDGDHHTFVVQVIQKPDPE